MPPEGTPQRAAFKTTDGSAMHRSHGKHKHFFNGIILKPKLEEHLQDKINDLKENLHFSEETSDLWLGMIAERSTAGAIWKSGTSTWSARWSPDMAREWPRTDIYKDFVANRHMSADQVMFKLYAERCRFCARRPMFQLCWKSPSVSVLSHVNGLLDGGATHRLRQYQRRERRSSSKIILETSTNWNAEFPSVNPNQDQQMHDFKGKIHKRGLKKINRKKSTRSE